MTKRISFLGLLILLGLLISGGPSSGNCLDETNPECFECRGYRFFPITFCAPVVADGTVGRCYCEDVPLPMGGSACQLSGDYCGVIIVSG